MTRIRAVAIALVVALSAPADARHAIHAGEAPAGTWSGQRGSGSATGAVTRLPGALRPLASARLPSAPVGAPAITAGGDILVATHDGLFVLPAHDEKTRLVAELPASPWSGPLLSAEGIALVPLASGDVVQIDLRERKIVMTIRAGSLLRWPGPWITADGSLAFFRTDAFVTVDAAGRVAYMEHLDSAPTTAVSGPSGALVTLASGSLVLLSPGKTPRALRTIGFPAESSLARHGDIVWIGDGAQLERRSLTSGARHRTTLPAALAGPPAVTPGGDVVVSLRGGLLLRLRDDGTEVERASLPGQDHVLGPIVDAEGRTAFVRRSGELGLVEGGKVTEIVSSCADPSSLASAGGRVVVLCDDGRVLAFGGDPAPKPSSP